MFSGFHPHLVGFIRIRHRRLCHGSSSIPTLWGLLTHEDDKQWKDLVLSPRHGDCSISADLQDLVKRFHPHNVGIVDLECSRAKAYEIPSPQCEDCLYRSWNFKHCTEFYPHVMGIVMLRIADAALEESSIPTTWGLLTTIRRLLENGMFYPHYVGIFRSIHRGVI